MFDRDGIVARVAKLKEGFFWDNPEAARGVIAEANAEKAVLNPFNELASAIEEAEMALEMADAEEPGEEQDLMASEATGSLEKAEKIEDKLRLQSLLCGKLDACNAILTLHSGAGGTEACDWAQMLFRMYQMYAEDAGFEVEVLDLQPGEEAGIKSVMFVVKGPYAYGYLKAERGVRLAGRGGRNLRRRGRRDQGRGFARGHLPFRRRRRSEGEQDRLRRPPDAYPHGHRGGVPGGALSAPEQGARHAGVEGETL